MSDVADSGRTKGRVTRGRFKHNLVPEFFIELATLLRAGRSLSDTLEILATAPGSDRTKLLAQVVESGVREGSPFGATMREAVPGFPSFVADGLQTAEQDGRLREQLPLAARFLNQLLPQGGDIEKKLSSQLMYPAAVMIMAFIVLSIMMIFVIPQFAELFYGFGADLSALTKSVIQASDFFVENWWWIFGLVGGLVWSLRRPTVRRILRIPAIMSWLWLHAPGLRALYRNVRLVRFLRTLSYSLRAGASISESLENCIEVVQDTTFERRIEMAQARVDASVPLSDALHSTGLFPPRVTRVLALGGGTDALPDMLDDVSVTLEAHIDQAVRGKSSAFEPLLMVVLGLIIGIVVVAMYLPIFKMGQIV